MNTEEILKKLVAFPTFWNQPNKAMIDWSANYAADCGAAVDVVQGQEEGKYLLIARHGPEKSGGVLLAGHSDTVVLGDKPWSSDPFTLTQQGDRLVGLGTTDMKGFLACALSLFGSVKPSELKEPAYLAMTYNEEDGGMLGADDLVAYIKGMENKPRWIWLGEPTSMQIANQHKGRYGIDMMVKGIAAHSSTPHLGDNAIDKAAEIICYLKNVQAELKMRPYGDDLYDPPYMTVTKAQVNGGTANNVVPDACSFFWDMRYRSEDDPEKVLKDLQAFVATLDHPERVATKQRFHIKAFRAASDPALERRLLNVIGTKRFQAFGAATEACLYQELGLPIYICGPGDVQLAHATNESISRNLLKRCDTCLKQYVLGS